MGSEPTVCALSKRLRTEARKGVKAFNRFLEGEEFIARFLRVPPASRRRAMQTVDTAEAIARMRDNVRPVAAPGRYPNAGMNRRWQNAKAQAQLRNAYAKAGTGEDRHVNAARLLRVSVGAARLAHKTYIENPATTSWGAASLIAAPQAPVQANSTQGSTTSHAGAL